MLKMIGGGTKGLDVTHLANNPAAPIRSSFAAAESHRQPLINRWAHIGATDTELVARAMAS